ncbi:glycosyltransferase family 39 protein [Candidatus Roizmanbacteria bacterium]|nr:glycosyltransferase family 39 protein [Candidatus Roizmanbacteria bacterium]
MKTNLFTLAILCFVAGLFLFNILINQSVYTTPFADKFYTDTYNHSQWVIPESQKIITDEQLYTLAGYRYIRGENPILLNAEAPPLGKYLIGISIIFFHNSAVASVVFALLCLLLTGLILAEVTRSFLAAAVGVLLVQVNSLFIDQYIHAPQLDIFQLFFFLVAVYALYHYLNGRKQRWLLIMSIGGGGFISTKIFFLSFLLFNAWVATVFFVRKTPVFRLIKDMLLVNFGAFTFYLAVYFQYFLHRGTLRGFFGAQKWIVTFYSSSPIQISRLFGSYINLLFLNRWQFWSKGYPIIHYQSWNLFWPLSFIFGLLAVMKLLGRKTPASSHLLTAILLPFFIIYNIYLFIVPVYPRYFLLLFIPLYLLAAVYFGTIGSNEKGTAS